MWGYLKNNTASVGFTILELLIAMAIGLLVLGALYGVFTFQNKTLSNQEQIVELQQNARAAMDMMTREISMAGYNPAHMSGTTMPQISAATANSISFVADLNGNGDTTAVWGERQTGQGNRSSSIFKVLVLYTSSAMEARQPLRLQLNLRVL